MDTDTAVFKLQKATKCVSFNTSGDPAAAMYM